MSLREINARTKFSDIIVLRDGYPKWQRVDGAYQLTICGFETSMRSFVEYPCEASECHVGRLIS